MKRVDALILAGRANRGAFREVSPAEWEALIEIAGRPMLSYVVDAVVGSPRVGRIVVVGPSVLRRILPERVHLVEPGADLVENVRLGVAALAGLPGEPGEALLVSSGDVPLLTPEIVDRFLDLCAPAPASVHYPVIRRETCEARYPGARRTYARLKEGELTGGNLFLVAPDACPPCLAVLERFFAARKSPVRLARLLGVGFLLKFLFKRAGISDAEAICTRLTGCPARAVICPDPEVGMDVDRPEHLPLAEAALRQR